MITITHGCSFTRYKWETWPKYLPWFEETGDVKNLGFSASGNETIGRGAVNSIFKFKNIKKMYIMWSGADRYEVVEGGNVQGQDEATYSRFDPDYNWTVWFGGHKEKDKHEYYQKNFLNERHNWFKTLERVLYTQVMLDKHKIDYTMMVFKKDSIKHDDFSNAERAIYNQIDWNRFKFYNDKGGLWEYANENFPEHFANDKDNHPCPYTHYMWCKEIIFDSKLELPENEKQKLLNRTNELKNGKLR